MKGRGGRAMQYLLHQIPKHPAGLTNLPTFAVIGSKDKRARTGKEYACGTLAFFLSHACIIFTPKIWKEIGWNTHLSNAREGSLDTGRL